MFWVVLQLKKIGVIAPPQGGSGLSEFFFKFKVIDNSPALG